MSITIDNAYIQTFESNLRLLAQQGQSLLRNFCMLDTSGSESHNWDMMGKAEARAKTSARMVSPAGGNGSGAVSSTDQLAYTRRKTLTKVYDTGEVIEQEDPRMMMSDPSAKINITLANALKRKIDDVIISAANDPALLADGTTSNFPSGQIVGGATTIISVDLLTAVQELFLTNDIDVDEQKVLVISPKQWRTLINIDKVTSSDHQKSQALATGYLPNFLGFDHFIISNRLGNTTTPPAAGQIYCLAFTTSAIGLHISRDIWGEVAKRPDMSFAWQFYAALQAAAVRVEDSHVVRIHLKDAQS